MAITDYGSPTRSVEGTGAKTEITSRSASSRRRPRASADADSNWYKTLMRVSAVAFVVVDARIRSRKADGLKDAGFTSIDDYLAVHPEDAGSLTSAAILDLNDRAVEMFGGSSRSQFLGASTDQFFDPLCPVLRNASNAYLEGHDDFQEQARAVRLDGSRFDAIFSAVMRVPGGTTGIWLVTFIDITGELRRRTAIEGLREELAHASRISMLGEMSASIAHELGQPLSGISMSAMAASRYLDRDEPDVQAARKILARISAQADRARDVMERVRAMAIRRKSQASRVAPSKLIREAARFVRSEFERSRTTCSIDVAEKARSLVVDRIQAQQLIVNLLMNAIQVMRDHGTPAPHVEISVRTTGDRCTIEVGDNGPGIASDQMARIFDSFYTSRADGIGLGLSICRNIAEAHGGSITAANRTDRSGAVFAVDLPLASDAGDEPG